MTLLHPTLACSQSVFHLHLFVVLNWFFGSSNNISLHAMAFGSKMDKPSSSQEGGVVGLNFHQSKEVLINDSNGSIYTVRFGISLRLLGLILTSIACNSSTRNPTVRRRPGATIIPMMRRAARTAIPTCARSPPRARFAPCSPRTCSACGATWASCSSSSPCPSCR